MLMMLLGCLVQQAAAVVDSHQKYVPLLLVHQIHRFEILHHCATARLVQLWKRLKRVKNEPKEHIEQILR